MNCDQLFCLSALCCIWTLNSNLVFGAKKDLYGILGIERTAITKDIKRAFRKLAVKYHPDKNKDPDAEKKFMEIAKAYEVLSDTERRRKYDQYGDDGEQSSGGGGNGGGFDFNFNDFFKGFDEASKTHHYHEHHHAHQDGFKFHFGGGNGGQHAQFFNFDDLFEDDDDSSDFLNFDPFSNLDMNFGFGDNNEEDEDFYGYNHYDRAHNNQHAQHMHDHANHMHQHKQQHNMHMDHNMHVNHMKMENIRMTSQGGRTCRTVTQKVGNTVTTHTECS